MYTSETAIYADSEGNVVPEDSPDAAIMVVAAGGTITDEEAAKYGLTDEGAKKPQAEEGEASKVADRPSPATDEMEDPLHVTAETVHGKGSSTAPTADDHPPATPKPAKK